MSIDELLRDGLTGVADQLEAPATRLDEVMRRGRRRRNTWRAVSALSGVAVAAAIVGVTALVVSAGESPTPIAMDETSVVTTTGQTADPALPPSGVVATYEGSIVADDNGYYVRPAGTAQTHRIVEGHSVESDGSFRFGTAMSDGDGGFVYSVLDLDSSSASNPGWVLWVPSGAAIPTLVAAEPTAGVGDIIGMVNTDQGAAVAYTTASGRSQSLRLAALNSGWADTVVEGFSGGDAAGDHIVGTTYTDRCTRVHLHGVDGAERELPLLPIGPCPDISTTVLSPDGRHLAFLDRQGDGVRLVTVDLVAAVVTYDAAVPDTRLVGFDGRTAYFDDRRTIDTESGEAGTGSPPPDTFQVNDRLVLQVPGGPEVDYDSAAASSPREPGTLSQPPRGDTPAWYVTMQSDSPDPPVELDGLGVTTTGLGPYVLGAPVRDISDTSGHDLVATGSLEEGCTVGAMNPSLGVGADDMTLVVEDGRMVRLDFSSSRFTYDGLGVGDSIEDVMRRYPEASITARNDGGVGYEIRLDDPAGNGTDVVFATNGSGVTSFRVGAPYRVTSSAPCW